MEFQAIGINEIETYFNRPNTGLIDMRTQEEYEEFHIQGAVNIPYDDLEKYKSTLSKNMTYILYCERGGSSLMAAKELSREGYHIYTVIGGINAIEDRNLN